MIIHRRPRSIQPQVEPKIEKPIVPIKPEVFKSEEHDEKVKKIPKKNVKENHEEE